MFKSWSNGLDPPPPPTGTPFNVKAPSKLVVSGGVVVDWYNVFFSMSIKACYCAGVNPPIVSPFILVPEPPLSPLIPDIIIYSLL